MSEPFFKMFKETKVSNGGKGSGRYPAGSTGNGQIRAAESKAAKTGAHLSAVQESQAVAGMDKKFGSYNFGQPVPKFNPFQRDAAYQEHEASKSNLRQSYREVASKNNGFLPGVKQHATLKEVELAKKTLPAPDLNKFKDGEFTTAKVPSGISKGKSVGFRFVKDWDFSQKNFLGQNGKLTGNWVSAPHVEHEDFLKEKY